MGLMKTMAEMKEEATRQEKNRGKSLGDIRTNRGPFPIDGETKPFSHGFSFTPPLPRHSFRAILTEVGLRKITDEVVQALEPRLRRLELPDLAYNNDNTGVRRSFSGNGGDEGGGGKRRSTVSSVSLGESASATSARRDSAAALKNVVVSVDVQDSMVGVGEDHLLWRLKGDVQVEADYQYRLRWGVLSDCGRVKLGLKEFAISFKLTDEIGEKNKQQPQTKGKRSVTSLQMGGRSKRRKATTAAPAASAPSTCMGFQVMQGASLVTPSLIEPFVSFQNLKLAISSRGGIIKQTFARKLVAPVFKRIIAKHLAREVSLRAADVINAELPLIKRRWRPKVSLADAEWRVDVALEKRIGYRVGGLVVGARVGVERESGQHEMSFKSPNVQSTVIDESLNRLAPIYGMKNHLVIFLQPQFIDESIDKIWSASFENLVSSSINDQASEMLSALELPEGSRPTVSTTVLQSPRITLSAAHGLICSAEISVEVSANAACLARYPGDVIHFKVNYAVDTQTNLFCDGHDVTDDEEEEHESEEYDEYYDEEATEDEKGMTGDESFRDSGDDIDFTSSYLSEQVAKETEDHGDTLSRGQSKLSSKGYSKRPFKRLSRSRRNYSYNNSTNRSSSVADKPEEQAPLQPPSKAEQSPLQPSSFAPPSTFLFPHDFSSTASTSPSAYAPPSTFQSPPSLPDGPIHLLLKLKGFKGKATIDSARVPGLNPNSEDFEATKSNVESMIEETGDVVWSKFIESIDGIVQVAEIPVSWTQNQYVHVKPKVEILDDLLAVKINLRPKEGFGKLVVDKMAEGLERVSMG